MSRLPPVYTLVAIGDDPFESACRAIGEVGTVLWRERAHQLDCSVALAPDRALRDTRPVARVALVALADALAVLAPPYRPIGVDGEVVLVDGARVGRVRFAAEEVTEDAVPDWAVIGVRVEILGDPADDSPGRHPDRTSLRDEGFEDVDAARVLESFCHHFLAWLDRWSEDPAAVDKAWRDYSPQGVP